MAIIQATIKTPLNMATADSLVMATIANKTITPTMGISQIMPMLSIAQRILSRRDDKYLNHLNS